MARKPTFYDQNRKEYLRSVCAKHIFGDDLKNYFERRFSGFVLSPQVWRANPIQCNPIFSHDCPASISILKTSEKAW